MNISIPVLPEEASAHLHPGTWPKVNRLLLRKLIAEFAHEGILSPTFVREKDGWGHYTLRNTEQGPEYRFRARILALHHWYIDTASIEKICDDTPADPDVLRFVAEFHDQMGIDENSLPVYMEEICSTLSGSAWMQHYGKPESEALLLAGYQQIEGSMTGHPRFIANNGRIGFDAGDYRTYAPETATPFPLLWLAGHKDRAAFTAIPSLAYEEMMQEELGEETLGYFYNQLKDRGLDPQDYLFLPVHPWQWFNKLSGLFAADIARQQLVCLGYGNDEYLPQQSIRTFFNVSHPGKRYVKTALSILNMGYVRGLSPYFMHTNPGINEWVYNLTAGDPYLSEKGFRILREVAGVSYRHQYFEAAIAADSPYKKMLAALWRESPARLLKDGQRLMTMAALLHVDNQGTAYLPVLIKASGLDITSWLQRYLDCYLSPLLHCFYKWDMVFMPHGENLILVLENHVPVCAIMKDIGEEVSLLDNRIDIPEVAQRLLTSVADEARTMPLFTQLFDSIFRFISAILVEHAGYPEEDFWSCVAACVHAYQERHPEFSEAFARFDLFVPEIAPDALNRLQLHNNRQLRNRSNPFADLATVGVLENPIARFRTQQ